MQIAEITTEPVELYKLLKFAGLVATGGEAKHAVSEGLVRLNGQTETQKRKKIVSGDVIQFGETTVKVQLANAAL